MSAAHSSLSQPHQAGPSEQKCPKVQSDSKGRHLIQHTNLGKIPPEILHEILKHNSYKDNGRFSQVCKGVQGVSQHLLGQWHYRNDMDRAFTSMEDRPDLQLQLLVANRMAWKQFAPTGLHRRHIDNDPGLWFLGIQWPWVLKFPCDSSLAYNSSEHYVQEHLHKLFPHQSLPERDDTSSHLRELCISMDFSKHRSHIWTPSKALQALQHGSLAKHIEFIYLNARKPDIGSFEHCALQYHFTDLFAFQSFMHCSQNPKYKSCTNSIQHVKIDVWTEEPLMAPQVHSPTTLRFEVMCNLRSLTIRPGFNTIEHPSRSRFGKISLPGSLRHLLLKGIDLTEAQDFPINLQTLSMQEVHCADHVHLSRLPMSLVHLRLTKCNGIDGNCLRHLKLLKTVHLIETPLEAGTLTTLNSQHLLSLITEACALHGGEFSNPAPASIKELEIRYCQAAISPHFTWNTLRRIEIVNLGSLTRFPDFRSFDQLEILKVADCGLEDEPNQFKRIPSSVRNLGLAGNYFKQVDLRHLKVLHWLDLQHMLTLDSHHLHLPESIKEITFGYCNLVNFPNLRHLENLTRIDVSGNPRLRLYADDLEHFEQMHCRISDDDTLWSH